ncbi:MAG TPA: NFACT RNA binding domain-containing protein [Ktedonobacteraceae bacterium]|jgi:predicted ribosome quality control (RQC) complex YloA/Tae2 family protein
MYIDALTLAALADEWRRLLARARIDTIMQPTAYSLALQCYAPGVDGRGGQNHWLNLSAHPQLARAHLTARKPAKIASEPPPFVMLLRKYLEGTRIEAVEQPRWERVVEISAGHPGAPGSQERIHYRLILELMGRMSNVILCNEEGLILGSLKHVGAEINRYRVIAPGARYIPPPPQQRFFAGQQLPRLEPTTIAAAQLALLPGNDADDEQEQKGRARAAGKLWQLLTRNLLGFSPLLAREAVYRALGESEVLVGDGQALDTWEELAWNVRELAALYDTQSWRPQLVERRLLAAETTPVAFAVYPLEQYSGQAGLSVHQSSSLNTLVDDYYTGSEWRDAMSGVRAPIRKVLQNQRERCKRKADLLHQEIAAAEEAGRYRLQAELLLAQQSNVTRGQERVELDNYYADQGGPATLGVTLDPRFDAVENANRLFNKYHKLRRALALIPAQIEQNDGELATIEQFLTDLDLAENPAEVQLVKAEVQSARYMRGAPEKKRGSRAKGKQGKGGRPAAPGGGVPLSRQSAEGFTILVGKNSRQNEEVTFHQASGNDLWLHARGVPGAHVIIKASGRQVPHATIEQAASLAAYYSQARGSTSVPVDYTLRSHVRHMKNGGPGMVIYVHERTLNAQPSALA